jgi:ribonuclease P protein component
VGIVITKKVGTAVERNRLRRRCKAILDQSSIGDSAMWYVVVFRPAAAQLSYQHLQEQLERALAGNVRAAGAAWPRREMRSA